MSFTSLVRTLEVSGLDIEVTNENKRDIDRAIHKLVGVEYKDCPTTWKTIKKKREADETGFITALRDAITA